MFTLFKLLPAPILRALSAFFLLIHSSLAFSQPTDSSRNGRFTIHAQTTVINQTKPSFSARYSGDNSLSTARESMTSLTATLFAGMRLWKGASVYLNPEIAGGSGLSQALGIADATNGETFRIGNPTPKIYLARLYYKQLISLTGERQYQSDGFNQVAGYLPTRYIALTFGKVSIADFFDANKFSHDARTQFMSWGLMNNGAWDYPANTRGYTPSLVLEYITPKHEFRYGFSLMPLTANGNDMNWDISKSGSHTLEYTHRHMIGGKRGAIRLLTFYTTTNMGSYRQSLALSPLNPDIKATRAYGRTKYGVGINAEQDITSTLGCFFRASWNDGNNETWAFTEIDRSISAGFVMAGDKWKRENDNIGLAYVTSGISAPHRDYLKAGGKGFMLGDGNLDYAWEQLVEIYYSAALVKNELYVTGAYQFLFAPGYNLDRKGPVHIFSVRVHARI